MSALVYELAWTRMLALTFGRTTLAASAVIGGFMGGMGLGAWLYHRSQRSGRAPLRIYAALELGIALSTALLTAGFTLLPEFFAAASSTLPGGLAMTLFRVGFVLILLLVPAALMGATYPALCSVLIHSRDEVGRHLGQIYGLNTLGAAAGALLGGLVLIEALGLRGAVGVANALNVAIAIGAWWLAGSARAALPAHESSPASSWVDDAAGRAVPSELPRPVTALVLFGSGLATLSYEIVWFRAFRYLFGTSTYALTLVLVVFLLGLGFGGMGFGFVVRRARPDRVLAWSQLAIALLAVAAIGALTAILGEPELSRHLSAFSPEASARAWQLRLLINFVIAMVLLFPATLMMGLSYPLATGLFLGDVRRVGAQVGAAYLLANLGSIAGAVLGAIFFTPKFGTIGGTWAIAMINVGLAAVILTSLPDRSTIRLAPAFLVGIFILVCGWVLPAGLPVQGVGLGMSGPGKLLFEEEGDLATVQVWSDPQRPDRRALTIDGTPIGVSSGLRYAIYSKQLLLAHLPMVIDSEIKKTLNIGLGSGSTVDALASHRNVTRLDVVEISASVARGSLLFEESMVLHDPRVTLVVEDVAHFMLRSADRYDLIISDGKQNSDFSGNVAMLCLDFYESAKRRLTDRGMLIQWIPQSLPHTEFTTVLRTFLRAFPHVEVFFESPGSVILVGSRSPVERRLHMSADRYTEHRAQSDLDQLGIPSPEALLSRWVASGEDLAAVIPSGPISTWNHSILDFAIFKAGSLAEWQARRLNLALLIDASDRAWKRGHAPILPLNSAFAVSSRRLRRARLEELRGNYVVAAAIAARANLDNPEDPQARATANRLARTLNP